MRVILLLLFTFLIKSGFGQSIYEIRFTEQNDTTHYKCFLVYYNENDSYARIAYYHQGQYRVIETKYKGNSGKWTDGRSYFSLTGGTPTYITPKTKDESYNPDYFVWIDKTVAPFTTDQAPNTTGARKVFPVTSYIKLNFKNLTKVYLHQFYYDQERDYLAFVKMTNDYDNRATITNNYTVTLHFITLANTLISDIGPGCQTDVLHLNNEFEDIAKTLKISFDPITITGAAFSKQTLLTQLNKLNVKPNDIVMFLYRGHGFRWSNQTSPYPMLALMKSHAIPVSDDNSILLENVYNTIVNKGGRLNIVLADCCNSSIGVKQSTGNNLLYMQSNTSAQFNKLNDLFMNYKGNLLFAASEKGESSWTSDISGGFFTTSFMQALSEETSYLRSTESSWTDIVTNTRSYAINKSNSCSNCTVQHAIFYNLITKR